MRVTNAEIEWQDNGLPFSRQFNDVYFSRDDELGESQHVFLAGNQLAQRWQSAEAGRTTFTIGELGFGCGLNFLQTWLLWAQHLDKTKQDDATLNKTALKQTTLKQSIPHQHLHYVAFEQYPLKRADLQRIYKQWPNFSQQSALLLQQYQDHSAGCHRIVFGDALTLDLYYGDARELLLQQAKSGRLTADAWFADGFSPAKNPELWQAELFNALAACSDTGTTLSTYSVAGAVRSALQEAGFTIAKQPGFGRKRHMLTATFAGQKTANNSLANKKAPWFNLPHQFPEHDSERHGERTAIVIGAGIAGCSAAWSLARRGFAVQLFDAAEQVFAGASGNEQLALRCRLQAESSATAEFFQQGYLFARNQFAALTSMQQPLWHPDGVVQLANAQNTRAESGYQDYKAKLLALYPEQIVRPVQQAELTGIVGCELATAEALYFPLGGWVDGQLLGPAYLQSPRITAHLQQAIARINKCNNEWQIFAEHDQLLASAATLILANSSAISQFEQCQSLPLLSLRGQASQVAASDASQTLRSVICGERTVFPALQNSHTLAASYASDNHCDEIVEQESQENLQLARSCFADQAILGQEIVGDRVAFRAATPDRMPLIGAVPDLPAMAQTYSALARDASSRFTESGAYHQGLYITAAHGSNGLSSAPLGGEILASLISEEALPVSNTVMNKLNPVRFLIRDLKRQKPIEELGL